MSVAKERGAVLAWVSEMRGHACEGDTYDPVNGDPPERGEALAALLAEGRIVSTNGVLSLSAAEVDGQSHITAALPVFPRCEATAPAVHTQAGARCERSAHGPELNHKVTPRDGLPGAVWSDGRVSGRLVVHGSTVDESDRAIIVAGLGALRGP